MKRDEKLGELLEAFVNKVLHPRGRALSFLAKASVTVDQAILLSFALNHPGSSPSSLASAMNISLPSISRMIERLRKRGLVLRLWARGDQGRKAIEVTAKAKAFLARLGEVRSSEFAAGMAALSPAARRVLFEAISRALTELS